MSSPPPPANRSGFRIEAEGSALELALDDVARARSQVVSALLVGAEQEARRAQVLAFIDDHPNCLHRTCLTGHLTGSALVVDPDRGRSLLIHHRKLDRWLQPGGHADGDANLGRVAWREATEETGLADLRLVTPALDIDIHTIPARSGEPEHLHLDLRFLVLVGSDRQPRPNDETLGARWLTPDDPAIEPGAELHRALVRAIDVAQEVTGINPGGAPPGR